MTDPKKKPLLLMILDGLGVSDHKEYNAVLAADMPCFQKLWQEYPHTLLNASGKYVGLPEGQMGNSEVGHLNIGAGRVVYQSLSRINQAIEDGSFYQNEQILKIMRAKAKNGHALHLMGLLSDGGVHSHREHLFALLEMAKNEGCQEVYIHAFLDGRDVAPDSGLEHIQKLEEKIKKLGVGTIASIMGRYYAMDRDKRWTRLEKAYRCLTEGRGDHFQDPIDALQASYQVGIQDEFVLPKAKTDEEKNIIGRIKDDDGIIFFNYRPDRAREITRAFTDVEFDFFEKDFLKPQVDFLCMTEYDKNIFASVAFPPVFMQNTLGEVLAQNRCRQLRIAETEKYAHVTFFFNGGIEIPNFLEDRILIPSPQVATYDLQPEMSAKEVTESLLEKLDDNIYDVIILNFANPDMVGHTGNFQATVEALEMLDLLLEKIYQKIISLHGTMLITADHGNVECMQGERKTSHTSNQVPFIFIREKDLGKLKSNGALADIAPTMLACLGISKPAEMTGESLILSK